MNKVSKALGAGVGGVAASAVTLPFIMPEGTPWYGVLASYAAMILLPAVAAYIAPKNS